MPAGRSSGRASRGAAPERRGDLLLGLARRPRAHHARRPRHPLRQAHRRRPGADPARTLERRWLRLYARSRAGSGCATCPALRTAHGRRSSFRWSSSKCPTSSCSATRVAAGWRSPCSLRARAAGPARHRRLGRYGAPDRPSRHRVDGETVPRRALPPSRPWSCGRGVTCSAMRASSAAFARASRASMRVTTTLRRDR